MANIKILDTGKGIFLNHRDPQIAKFLSEIKSND